MVKYELRAGARLRHVGSTLCFLGKETVLRWPVGFHHYHHKVKEVYKCGVY